MKRLLLLLLLASAVLPLQAQHSRHHGRKPKAPLAAANEAPVSVRSAGQWVDSLMGTMTLEQKAAQLVVIRVPLNMDAQAQSDFEDLLCSTQVGGVCFFVGTARETLPLIRRFQSLSSVPLLVCIDAEWGLGMRLKDCYAFPHNAAFGLLPHEMDTLVFAMGREIGRQCRKMGIHVNFAPVVDVNSNPRNPVIGPRSFSADPARVAQLGIQYMNGLQSQGVMAVAKHFPGHGDTETDSHFDLPVISHTRQYMDTVDLYPFQQLIDAGVQGVMTAHLQVTAYESEPNHPSSLSPHLVSELLRKRMGFKGLVITDGLDMKGVTKYYRDGEAELAALLAGSDILLLPPDVPQAIHTICAAAEGDPQLRRLIDLRCRRVLRAKYSLGCADLHPDQYCIPDTQDSLRCAAITEALLVASATKTDSIVNDGIANHAYPGCQVVVLKDGKTMFRKSYGRLSYNPDAPQTTMNTVYDLASVTKVAATTLAVMKLYETHKIRLDDPLSRYLPYLRHTDKARITIRQALSHVSGLNSFAPFWKAASVSDDPRQSVLDGVAASPLKKTGAYLYSDMGFMLLGDLVEKVSGLSLDLFVERHFYHPMGLFNTCFRPLSHGVDTLCIAPTENDQHYRRHLVQGEVHDENAYAMGGVSGHAGLFSTADDLGRLMQMLLNGGTLDGRRYLKEETIKTFNTRYYDGCRRGLGFDKPLLSGGGPVSQESSQLSFGHTGFTGTMVWADPATGIVFIFLSNRVHPNATPNRLADMNIRTQVMSEIYRVLAPAAMTATDAAAAVATFGN